MLGIDMYEHADAAEREAGQGACATGAEKPARHRLIGSGDAEVLGVGDETLSG
jgi:hypothetical protein